MRILALATHAFGGRGGIAQHTSNVLRALATAEVVEEVVTLPRAVVDPVRSLPEGVDYRTGAAGSKPLYLANVLRSFVLDGRFDLILCGHLNLLPVAALAARRNRAPLALLLYGIDAWRPHQSAMVREAIRLVDLFLPISDYTAERFMSWAPVDPARVRIVGCAVDLNGLTPGPPAPSLIARYNLAGRAVILTLARLSASERYKGIEEVLHVLPAVRKRVPEVAYVIAGDGDDRLRLEAEARRVGVEDSVVFTGYVPEQEKTAHFRLARVFALAGRGEGFGIVLLESLACGVPVIGSALDATREVVRRTRGGWVVHPDNQAELTETLAMALRRDPLRAPKSNLSSYSLDALQDAVLEAFGDFLGEGKPAEIDS